MIKLAPKKDQILLTCTHGINAYMLPVLILIWTLYFLLIVTILLTLTIRNKKLSISPNGIGKSTIYRD